MPSPSTGTPCSRPPAQSECMASRTIARVFNRHAVSRLYQQLCTKADGLLCATGDHNLFSRALHAPRAAQVRGDQTAQAAIACRVAIAQLFQVGLAPRTPHSAWPRPQAGTGRRRCTPTRNARGCPNGGCGRWWSFTRANPALWITSSSRSSGKFAHFVDNPGDKPVDNPVDTFVDNFLAIGNWAT